MAGRVRTLNLKRKGLHFLSLLASHPIYLAPFPFPGPPERAVANDLSVAACVGQDQGFGIRKTWGTGFPAVQRDSMLQTLIP